ncbi:EVE domain-containing protein [Sulfurihydrogenibium sp.]|uniref:EVE domain-containing protein n=1 Tax=Sulfurihydrogenibium sp. TaxID=2053621 RepID=UPI0026336A14|nr:EVE domain-containing protein [Sulfurihydrogenibium sp.]
MENYYLLKTESQEYSYDDLEKEGKTVWNGVKNPLAQKFIKEMKIKDKVFIYHSGKEKAIVGLGEVISNPYLDENNLYVVDIKPLKRLKPLTLKEIKSMPEFKDFYLVKMPRLSVMKIPENLVKLILEKTQGG